MTNRFCNAITGCLLTAVAVLGLGPASVLAEAANSANPKLAAQNHNPAVFPVSSKPYGLTYGEWSARFWQWEFSLPVDRHPLFETADCSAGQSGQAGEHNNQGGQSGEGETGENGRVWFLGGTSASFEQIDLGHGVILGQATRSCTVPEGTALFFPLVNTECSSIDGDHPGYGTTEPGLRACANFFGNFIVPGTLSATLDGIAITALNQFRVQSPLFRFGPLPANNIFGIPAGGTASSVSDGVHLMLHPLSAGPHVLKFHGEMDLRPVGGSDFVQDITYNLMVRH